MSALHPNEIGMAREIDLALLIADRSAYTALTENAPSTCLREAPAPICGAGFTAGTAVGAKEAPSRNSLAVAWVAWHAFCSGSAAVTEPICIGAAAVD